MRVLVLGCGEMGEMAVKDLYQHGDFDEIIVGTRSIEKVNRLRPKLKGKKTRISPRRIDVTHSDELDSLLKECDVAINCTGPNYKHEVHVAEAAIKAGVNLVDINDEYESTFKMLELDPPKKSIKIYLKYGPKGEEVITKIIRVSKPGRRIYRAIKELPLVLNGLGINVLSTPKGIISDRKAREENVGGEVLCKVW